MVLLFPEVSLSLSPQSFLFKTDIFSPQEPGHSAISANLSSLTAAATHFETECRLLILRSQREPLNQNFVTQQVIQCAFDIAKATKQLVALFQ